MPIRPLSSPSHDRLHTPKQEPVSGSVSSPSNKIRHSSSKHKKQLHHDKRSSSKVSAAAEESDNVTAALTWKEQLGQILAILVVATLVYYSTSVTIQWLQEASKPFCDDKDSPQVMVSGDCIPCPENGQCRNGRLQCLPGFRRHGRSCVPDKEVDRNAQELASFLQTKVCQISGRSLCDGLGTTWVMEDELWDMAADINMGMDESTLSLVREKAVDLVQATLLIRTNPLHGSREFMCPIELAQRYKPFVCRIKEAIRAHLLVLFSLGSMAVLVASFVHRYLRRKRLLARAEQLYLQVCEVLGERSMGSSDEAKWVVASRLRDHLLLPSERKLKTLWKEVELMVQEDSRIDQYQMMVKGETRIVWEWQVEGALHTHTFKGRSQQRLGPTVTK
ncbi:unnamed protein product [Sphagnum balticum]